MNSPTDPPKPSIRDRVSQRLSTDSSGHYIDAEARHTRNVTWLFIALIVLVGAVALIGLAYGYWEGNLKPLASVNGTDVGRGQWQDRQELEQFRSDRAERQVRAALADGTIGGDLANRRLNAIAAEREGGAAGVMQELVDLIFKEQLAADMGITATEDEVALARAADGTSPEARRVDALVINSEEQQIGLPPTPEGTAEARARAEDALVKLEEGASVADLVDEYSPATAARDGDIGYFARGEIADPVLEDAIFAAEVGGITPIVESEDGALLIGVVSDIVEASPDTGFLSAVDEDVGEAVHTHNIELETIADKLEAQVVADAVDTEYEQVKLAQILLAGDASADPADDEGAIRASHILYQPAATDEDGQPIPLEELPEDDPAWDEAGALAEAAAADLRAIEDADARAEAFAERARTESDGPTGATGGDLGFFARDDMVPEFADVVFDADDPQHGDILGPVRSEFGWHTIMYDEARAPLAQRVDAVQKALAESGADFAEIAAEYSDGPEALDGGETGWHIIDDLDAFTKLALTAIDVGETTEPIEGEDGFTIYQKLDEGTRPLEPEAAARLAQTAFADWYSERYFDAEGEGRISIDDSVFPDQSASQQAPVLPPLGGHGG